MVEKLGSGNDFNNDISNSGIIFNNDILHRDKVY